MYGRYREKKFDALGLTFRLENLANIYFERLIDSLGVSFITRATFFEIIRVIHCFFRAMQLDGISSHRLETQLKLLGKSWKSSALPLLSTWIFSGDSRSR